MMYYLQKHGENLETAPASYGCLHPKWQKRHKAKQLSTEEWSALWQVEQCSMEPINPKTSHHMTSLDKWTVSFFISPPMQALRSLHQAMALRGNSELHRIKPMHFLHYHVFV